MIKVTVMYPNEEGKKFDMDYYVNKHIPMVAALLTPGGLIRGEVEKGSSGTDPNSPPMYVAVGGLYFSAVEEVHAAFSTHGRASMGDIPNYTDIKPQF
ncbi:MAG: EthD family reductase, partial [Dehalococcoidia bacterium]|nr:EthD family reductase [Dehalococcoidia bacterium]